MSKLPPSSLSNALPRGIFCFRCHLSNFTDDGKGRRSLAQHLQHCKAPNKSKSNFTKWHKSGTDPFHFLSKKQRIDQSAFNYAHQRDHYLEGETAVLDNFFVGDADHDFSQGSIEFPYVYEDASPPLVNNNIINLSLVPMVNSGLPYNKNAPLPPSYQFKIKLQTILDHHRINLTVHDEIIDLVRGIQVHRIIVYLFPQNCSLHGNTS
jgi:hypothetical protein